MSEEEVKVLLPNYWTLILKQVAKKKPEAKLNDLKFSLSQMLEQMNTGRIELDEEQDQRYHAFYYMRGKGNVTQLHEYIQSRAKTTLGQLYKLRHEASSGEMSNPDLEFVNDEDEPIIDIEVETGLSNSNLGRLRERVIRALNNGVKVNVVVPNEEQSAKYTKNLLELILEHKDSISILTLRELREWVGEVKKNDDTMGESTQKFQVEEENRSP